MPDDIDRDNLHRRRSGPRATRNLRTYIGSSVVDAAAGIRLRQGGRRVDGERFGKIRRDGSAAQYGGAPLRPLLALGLVGGSNRTAGGQYPGISLLRVLSQARCFVHRITDHGVLVAVLCADVAGENE